MCRLHSDPCPAGDGADSDMHKICRKTNHSCKKKKTTAEGEINLWDFLIFTFLVIRIYVLYKSHFYYNYFFLIVYLWIAVFLIVLKIVLRLSTAAITSCSVVPLKAKGQIELTSIILIK